MTFNSPTIPVRESPAAALRRQILLISPPFVVLMGQIAGNLFAPVFGEWTIFPWLVAYWGLIVLLLAYGAGPASLARWAGAPRGAWWWSALALAFLPITLPIFLDGLPLLQSGWLWLPWLLFAPLNALLEESYWRGLVLDAGRRHPAWLMVAYTSLFFALNHAGLSAFVAHYRGWLPLLAPAIAGLVYGTVYWKTGSLRWVALSHTLVGWLGMGILVLMNVYVS